MLDKSVVYHQDFDRPRLPWLFYTTGYILDTIDVIESDYRSFFYVVRKETGSERLNKISSDAFSIDEKIRYINRLNEYLSNNGGNVRFSKIADLAVSYVHYYWGDKNIASQMALILSRDNFLKNTYSGMFGELGVEGFPLTHLNKGCEFLEYKNFNKAIDQLLMAEKFVEDDFLGKDHFVPLPKLYFKLGESFLKIGDKIQAKLYLEKSYKLSGNAHVLTLLKDI